MKRATTLLAIASLLGAAGNVLEAVASYTEVRGVLHPEGAYRTGFPVGTPVVARGGPSSFQVRVAGFGGELVGTVYHPGCWMVPRLSRIPPRRVMPLRKAIKVMRWWIRQPVGTSRPERVWAAWWTLERAHRRGNARAGRGVMR